ncbi:MAG: hypothetical protein IJS32_06300 [Kiritimatiellae bacterium]|nr:hypothetical protein [Kiritimatiellia bacterium]
MTSLRRILFDTAWGPAVAWFLAAVFTLLAMVFETSVMCRCGLWFFRFLSGSALFLFLAATVAALAAFARALLRKQWLRAALQAVLGVAAVLLAKTAILPLHKISEPVESRACEALPWTSTRPGVPFPFAIEHRILPVPPFSGAIQTCDMRIAFPSGKRIRLGREILRPATATVHALDAGRYALVDVRRPDYANFFRIDPGAETVEVLAWNALFALPPESLLVFGGRSGNDRFITIETPDGEREIHECVPVGDAFANRRYLGLVGPDGNFTTAGPNDPRADLFDPSPSDHTLFP